MGISNEKSIFKKGGEQIMEYIFTNKISADNYSPLRSLAQKLTAKEFKETTGFGHGVHNRIRRFKTFEEYKNDEKERAIKYGYIQEKGNSQRITVTDVYSKLQKLEAEIVEIKKLLSK